MSTEIVEVPIQDVFPGENVRKHLNSRWLVDSIAELGILEPLKVYRNPAGELTVLDGHRRLHAAKSAGLRTVKCIIEEDAPLEDDRILKQMVLNEAREGLSEADQIAATYQLSLFNVPAERVAKLAGKDKQQFANVVTVASKDATREIAVDCTLTLAQALKVAQAEDDGADMDYLAEHLEAVQRQLFSVGEKLTDLKLDNVISHAISFPYVQAKRAELEDAGAKTLGEDDDVPEDAKALWELGLTAEQHQDCPHRLVKVAPVSWNPTSPHVSEYCTDPEAAGHTEPSQDEYDAAQREAQRVEAEERHQLEEERKRVATEYRREFVKRKLTQLNDGKLPKELFVLAIAGNLNYQTIVNPALLEELGSRMGIRDVPQDKDECIEYLIEFANKGFIDSLRVLALVTLVSFEIRSQALYPDVGALRLYYETLEKWGHVLTPSECGQIGRLTNEDSEDDTDELEDTQ